MSLNNILNKPSDIPSWANLTINSLDVKEGINASQIANIHIENGTPLFEEALVYNGHNWEFKHVNELAIDADFIKGIPVSSDTPLDNQILTYNQSDNLLEYKSDITSNNITSNSLFIANTIFVSSKESISQFINNSNPSDITYDIPFGYSLYFTKVVDLEGRRLVCDAFTTLAGNGLETSGIKSTGLNPSTAIISSTGTITLNNVRIDCNGGTAFSLIGRLMPRTIHAVTKKGFKLKALFFVVAYAFTKVF